MNEQRPKDVTVGMVYAFEAGQADADERFVRLASAVAQLRDFLALHRKATGRSDVNIRKVIALIDEALLDNPISEPGIPEERSCK